MVRAFKENPASFLVRAFATLVLPAAGLYYWNRTQLSDEERATFENIPQNQKDNFFIIGIPRTGEFVRIPKPFEAGMLFATSTERFLGWLEENDPEAYDLRQ
ncbi:LPD38 domain-containing protein, partial [Paenibacillus sp. P22]|uniref:LPD38 domain-containing protein n=1 Tax=Paenibacillus sp. P22 TaxID=483908 RepID=UPI001E3825ED